MAGAVDALERAILDHILNDGTYTPPSNWFVALSTTVPADDGSGFTEPVGASYARVSTSGSTWTAASGTSPATKSNGVTITFPQATGSWGTVTHFGLFIASSGGTVQIWGALDTSVSIGNGDTRQFPIGELKVQLGDPGDVY